MPPGAGEHVSSKGNDGRKLTKNEKRRLRQKEEKERNKAKAEATTSSSIGADGNKMGQDEDLGDVQIEYVSAQYSSSVMDEFQEVFAKFAKPEELTAAKPPTAAELKAKEKAEKAEAAAQAAAASLLDAEGNLIEREDEEEERNTLSRKKKKLASRLSVAELKQLVPRPDVVEAHDVTSADPRLLVYLKSYRNTVQVPRHWCHKRKYLQGKRGIEKTPFQLPEFIAETGIAKIRESVMEQEGLRKAKQKARERLQPKMGKIDIDYQVLHDAFFKYQKKPKLTGHGDLYYEGKEFEIDMKHRKAGTLSAELLGLLGMEEGGPPPWLINMQRYGPPPSYPSMRIPGLNAPIPPGAKFGYQADGWGKPPVDEYGRPLYGDVFGTAVDDGADYEANLDKSRWGEVTVLEEYSEDEDEEDEDEEDEEEVGDDLSGMATPSTLDGTQSMASGLETPDTIDLRKRTGMETPDLGAGPPQELFQVLRETRAGKSEGAIFGSEKTYVLPGRGDVEMSINPDQLETQLGELGDQEGLQDAYDAQKAAVGAGGPTEGDLNDINDPREKRKRRADTSMAAKRHKDFKF